MTIIAIREVATILSCSYYSSRTPLYSLSGVDQWHHKNAETKKFSR